MGRITPDGWPLDGASWTGSGQLEKRFDIAAAIGNGNTQLFTPPGSRTREAGFPMLTSRLYYDAIEPHLTAPHAQRTGQGEHALCHGADMPACTLSLIGIR